MIFTTLIEPMELHALAVNQKISKHNDLLILDTRCSIADPQIGKKLYQEGHVPNAVLVDFDEVVTGHFPASRGRHPMPDRETFRENMGKLGVDSKKQIVVYDQGGLGFASRVWYQLRWLGLEKAAVLNGGMKAWLKAGLPVSIAAAVPSAGRIDDADPLEVPVPMKVLQDNLTSKEFLVMDARSNSRFHGIGENIDRKAGHIPGSISRSGSESMTKDGAFRPAPELRKEFLALMEGRKPNQIIHSCGSGVNATISLLAMDYAGLFGSRLYPGSWSEWIEDDNNPISCD
ncbi:MAG: sulfurtransferase [Klebsiella quasipneumoniae]|nr:sulfurtransferase [Klebsiella quasipneumoniae]